MTAEADPAGFRAQPEAMRAALGNVSGLLVSSLTTMLALESLVVDATAFTALGGGVATANTTMQGKQSDALRSTLQLLQNVADRVHQVAADYEQADRDVAHGLGSVAGDTTSPGAAGLWSPTVGADVLAAAVHDASGTSPDPHTAGPIVDYLHSAGAGGDAPAATVTADAGGFADWLDSHADHQAQVGVIGVYSGTVRTLTDVPGGVRAGDVVVIDPYQGGREVAAVVGPAGLLLNRGTVTTDFSAGAAVRVYRPLT